jgi:phosphoglycerate dehydrogenase-like enzyme
VFVRAPTVSDGDGGARPSEESVSAIRQADAYLGFGMSRPLFAARSDKLRWIHSAAAGVRALLFDELVASAVVLTNSAGVHAVPIAEYVLGGLLHLLRQFDVAVALQREARWDKEPFVGPASRIRELGECRVLIVGTGGIGGEVGRRLGALGARCVGVRRRPELGAPDGFERVVSLDSLDRELPNADVIVLAAPFTASTNRLLTAERLDRLPDGAIVVNVARGALVDTEALVRRLRDGGLRGAVLDVFEEEPLPATDPLWTFPQVLLTPHVSAVSPGRFWHRQIDLFVENWRRFDRGEPMRNVVDKREGY